MTEMKTILVPIDGSKNASRALAHAVCLAEEFDSRIVLLSVLEQKFYVGTLIGLENKVLFKRELEEVSPDPKADEELDPQKLDRYQIVSAKRELRQLAKKVPPSIPVKMLFLIGSPREDILQVAEDEGVDTIVIGSRGLGTLKGVLLGSVSKYVLQNAKQPVFVVK